MGFGKRIDGCGGRRAAERDPVLMSGLLTTMGRRVEAELLDISRTGARLRPHRRVSLNESTLLKAGAVTALGQVVWSSGEQCGLTFEEPLSDEELDTIRCLGKRALDTFRNPDDMIAAEIWVSALVR